MKRVFKLSLAVVLAIVLLVGVVMPVSVLAQGETRYEYYNAEHNTTATVWNYLWQAQTFTPQVNHIIESVKIKAYRLGSPGTWTVGIRAVDGEGDPTGEDLAVGTTNANTLTTETTGEWREIILNEGYALDADTVYALVFRISSTVGGNTLYLLVHDYDGSQYPRGEMFDSATAGDEWAPNVTDDLMFEVWGSSSLVEPTAETLPATDVVYVPENEWWTVDLNGKVTDDGGEPCDAHFYYRIKSEGPDNWEWAGVSGTYVTDETFEATLYDILPETRYEFLAMVVNSTYEEAENEEEWLAKSETGEILEFEAEETPGVPVIITLGYPMDKDEDNFKTEVYGQVGYDGASAVDVWFEFREYDTPPWVLVGATTFIPSGGFELPDWWGDWTLGGVGAIKGLSTEQVKEGTYSLRLEKVGANVYIKQSIVGYERFKGETVTMGAWVWASTANTADIAIFDGVTETFSSKHTGSSTWEWLTVTVAIDAEATEVRAIVHNKNVIGHIFIDEVSLVRGSIILDYYTYHGYQETGGVAHVWLEGLELNTYYDYRMLGENDEGQGTGGIGTFVLHENVVIPTIRTDEVKWLTDTDVWLYATNVDDGGMMCWSYFEYRRAGQSSWIETPSVQTTTGVEFLRNIDNLNTETMYEYRGVAWNEAGTGYGAIRTFGTLEAIRTPSIKTGRYVYVDDATMKVYAEVVFDGGSGVELWIQWRVLGESVWNETEPVPEVETGYEIFALLTDLDDNWWYEYRAVGTNDIGRGYGAIESFNIKVTVEEEGGDDSGIIGVNPFDMFDDWLAKYGLDNEGGHWLIMIVFMFISFAIFYKVSSVLRVVIPLCFFALFIAMGWISTWIVLLLAFGAGITLFMMLRKQVSGGG